MAKLKRTCVRTTAISCGILWSLASTSAALAQEREGSAQPQGPAVQQENEVESPLGVIIVTAQRRAEDVQDVPISASVFDSDFIADNLSDPRQIANFTPNYQVTRSSEGLTGGEGSIRGLGASDQANPLSSSSFLVIYDGIPTGTPITGTIPQWDLERIEVFRGPQGTLFGRNAVAGAIQYTSAMPTDYLEGYGRMQIGQFNLRRFEGAVSGPITDGIAARVSGFVYSRGGDVYNEFLDTDMGERDLYGFRGIIDWDITDALDVRLKAQRFVGDAEPIFFNAARSEFMTPDQLGWFEAVGFDPDLSRKTNYKVVQSGNQFPKNAAEVDIVELNLNYDFGSVGLAFIGGYINAENEITNVAIDFPAQVDDQLQAADLEQYSAELRLTSQTDSPFQWILGGYYQKTDDSFSADIDLSALLRDADGDGLTRHNGDSPEDLLDGIVPAFVADNIFFTGSNSQRLETYAGFLHTSYQWTDRLKTTHAIRFTHESKDVDYLFNSFFEFPVSIGVVPGSLGQHFDLVRFAGLTPEEQRAQAVSTIVEGNTIGADGSVIPYQIADSWDEVTWRLSLDYQVSDDVLLYASASKGFRGGIFSVLVPGPANAVAADPEKSLVYELGLKSRMFDNRLQLNASVFYDDHTDYQTSLFTTDPSAGILNNIDNLPKSELYGGEIEIQAVPVDNLLIVANLGLLDTKITKVLPGNEGLIGNELPLAEDLNFSGLVKYDIETKAGIFAPQASWRYWGEYFSLKENNDEPISGKPGGFWTVDLRLGWESTDGNVFAAAFWNNVFNEVHPTRHAQPLAASGHSVSVVNDRRNWGLEIGFRF